MSDERSMHVRDPLLGRLVVVPDARARGVGRLVACVPGEHGPLARVFFYDDGTWGLFARERVVTAPPGVWNKGDS
jgi:hypothetical protein